MSDVWCFDIESSVKCWWILFLQAGQSFIFFFSLFFHNVGVTDQRKCISWIVKRRNLKGSRRHSWYVVVTPTPKKCSQEKEFLRFGFFSGLLVAQGCANYFFICFDIVLCHFSVISSYSKGRSLEGSRSLSAIFLSFHTSIGPCSFLENVVLNPSMLLLLLLYVSSSRVSRCWLGRCPVVQNTAAAAGARLGVEATVGAFVCLSVDKHCDLEFLFWGWF